MPRERPVHQPKGVLETAAPVGAERIRALIEPRLEERSAGLEIALLTGEVPRLRERHQLVMPIDFPQVLDVADDARIAIVEALAEQERSARAGFRIDVPFRRETERRRAQRKHVEAPGQN